MIESCFFMLRRVRIPLIEESSTGMCSSQVNGGWDIFFQSDGKQKLSLHKSGLKVQQIRDISKYNVYYFQLFFCIRIVMLFLCFWNIQVGSDFNFYQFCSSALLSICRILSILQNKDFSREAIFITILTLTIDINKTILECFLILIFIKLDFQQYRV